MVLNQRDPRWAGIQLGTCSPETIGSDGCLITSIAEINNTTPIEVNKRLTANGGYTRGCLMYLDVKRRVPDYKALVYLSEGYADVPVPETVIATANSWIKNGADCICQVSLAGGTHFMRLTQFFGAGLHSNAIVHDPWTGEEMAITDKYGRTAPIALVRLFCYSDVTTRGMNDYSDVVQDPIHGVLR